MKCISLWQPWATLVSLGEKRVETRSWETKYRGPLAIHAAKKWDRRLEELSVTNPAIFDALTRSDELRRRFTAPEEDRLGLLRLLPTGCIIATCTLVACLPTPKTPPPFGHYFDLFDSRRLPSADPSVRSISPAEMVLGDYSPGRWAWFLDDIKPLAKPIHCTGRQRIFDVEVPA
ncbi:MAG: ASCH domain-containing protein [Phycisphaerales bacterium]|nr:ASCH domain-containing protein [Phycisphaerales bacterium]